MNNDNKNEGEDFRKKNRKQKKVQLCQKWAAVAAKAKTRQQASQDTGNNQDAGPRTTSTIFTGSLNHGSFPICTIFFRSLNSALSFPALLLLLTLSFLLVFYTLATLLPSFVQIFLPFFLFSAFLNLVMSIIKISMSIIILLLSLYFQCKFQDILHHYWNEII